MRKPELAAAIADSTDLTKAKAHEVINAVIDKITDALAENEAVTLIGFGTFSRRHRGATTGRHPQTGQVISIPARNNVAFKPGKALRHACNSGLGEAHPGGA